MRIAIIGAGSVGGSTGPRLGPCGARDPARGAKAGGSRGGRTAGKAGPARIALAPAEAVRDADVVVLATPWDATLELARRLPLAGKVVIDATNPLLPDLAGLAVAGNTSGGEEVARAAPGARVVKCFNTTGANNFLAPEYPDGAATMLYAGDDPAAKAVVAELGRELGFAMLDAGPLAPGPAAGAVRAAVDYPGPSPGAGAGDRVQADAAVGPDAPYQPPTRRLTARSPYRVPALPPIFPPVQAGPRVPSIRSVHEDPGSCRHGIARVRRGQPGAAGSGKLATQDDSVSYILGYKMGENLKQQSVPVKPEIDLPGPARRDGGEPRRTCRTP